MGGEQEHFHAVVRQDGEVRVGLGSNGAVCIFGKKKIVKIYSARCHKGEKSV